MYIGGVLPDGIDRNRRRLLAAGLLQLAGGSSAQPAPTSPFSNLPPGMPAASSPSMAAGGGLPLSRPIRPKAAFEATTVAAAQAALGASAALPGPSIRLEAPAIATATGSVTVGISAELAGVSQLAVLVHRASFPLAALIRPDGTRGPYEVTIHLERADRVTALVQADGKWYSASREIKMADKPW